MTDSHALSRIDLPPMPDKVDWQVAVFCQNEGNRLAACLRSIDAAVGGRPALISVILNGSTDNSVSIARETLATLRTPATLFVIPAGDKSNAINRYVHDRTIRVEASLYFAVDGYAVINSGGLAALEARLHACPTALAAAGVAGNGRTSPLSNHQTATVGGVLRGQFYCMTPSFVRRMEDAGLRLPVGLYRGDGLLGSMAAHDLDSVGNTWENDRIVGTVDAVFLIDPLSPFRLRDLRRYFNRKVRQMRGLLENAAIRAVAHARGFAALPANADDMIRGHLASHPAPTVTAPDRPFMALALRHHRRALPPAPAATGTAPGPVARQALGRATMFWVT